MNWSGQIDIYCERVDFAFWAEPVNAITNAAFLLVALWLWSQTKGVPLARALCAIVCAIGIGSFLFHTTATGWAAFADVAAILVFVLVYIYTIHRRFWGHRIWVAAVSVALFFPYAGVLAPIFRGMGLGGSGDYVPILMLLVAHAVLLLRKHPRVACDLLIGAGIFTVSLALRTLDPVVCSAWPLGTHFAWHCLNAVTLGWLIMTLIRFEATQSAQYAGSDR